MSSDFNDVMIEDLNFWSSQLFSSEYPLHHAEVEGLLKALYDIRDQQQVKIDSEVAVHAKHALFESELNLLEQDQPNLQNLKGFIQDLVGLIAQALNEDYWPEDAQADVKIIESWYHITENGGYHDTHSHPNCSWCGIYYVQEGECELDGRNGVNRFYDPRHGADQYQDAGTAYLSNEGFIDFTPRAGQLIIFPSYLKHAAMPYFGDKDRIVIAFNCQVNLAD